MSNPTTDLSPTETEALTRRGLRLAQFTVGYNVIEGIVAVTAGLMAGLVSVVGFGIDSGIESIAAVLVALRLSARLRHGEADERKERVTLKLPARGRDPGVIPGERRRPGAFADHHADPGRSQEEGRHGPG